MNHAGSITGTLGLYLLEVIPGNAMVVENDSLIVVAANATAKANGIDIGQLYYQTLGDNEYYTQNRIAASGDDGTEQQATAELNGVVWSMRWVPLGDNHFLYSFDAVNSNTDVSASSTSAIETQELRESEKRYHTLFSTMALGVVYQDAEGAIINANPAAERILGLTLDQMKGLSSLSPDWKSVHEDFSDYPGDEHPAMVALRTGKSVSGVIMGVYHPDKKQHVWISINAIPLFREGEKPPYQVYTTFEDITTRKVAEEKHRLLFKEMLDGFALHEIICDENGKPVDYRFITVNPAFEKITALRNDAIAGKRVREVLPGLEQSWIDIYGSVALTGEPAFFENYSAELKKYFKVTAFRPAPGQFACIFSDITRQRETDKLLRRSEETYRALVKGLPDIITRFDREGRHLFISENVQEIVDIPLSDFIGKTHRELGFPENVVENWENDIEKVCATGEPFESEFTFTGKAGQVIFNTRLLPEFDAEGKVVSLLSISRDITQHKLVESRFQKFYSQMAQMACIIDTDGHLLDVNKPAVTNLGLEKKQLIGRDFESIFAEESCERVRDLLAWWQVTGEVRNEELVIQRATGEKRTVLMNMSAIRDDNGEIINGIVLQSDITELKMYQQEILRSQQLESLGALAGGIAHDFNNLLGGVYGYVDIASGYSDDEKVEKYLDKALASIDRARGLTQQLLTFAKGGAPMLKVQSLFPFVNETVRFALSGSRVSCRCEADDSLWTCTFDRNQISQVIDNIVINAQEAMPEGGELVIHAENRTVAAKTHSQLTPGRYVAITITDTGIGIAPEKLPHVFDPFFTTKSKGHGLGLATCYSIVKRHEGCIDISSEPGKGTAFTIWLPASSEKFVEDTRVLTDTVFRGSGRILVVDDEEILRDTMQNMLESVGYTVVCQSDGESALEFFKAEKEAGRELEGVILDLTIPGGIGGREIICIIRELDATIPVFVASGYAEDPVMADPQRYGFTGSIKKPFRKKELLSLLECYFQEVV